MKKILLVLLTAVLSFTLFVSVSATSEDPVVSDDSAVVSEDIIADSSVIPEEPSSVPEASEAVSETESDIVSETESDIVSETESEAVSSEAISDESSKDDMGIGDLDFQPNGFARNLKYMGLGMLGIFVVVGVVILITFVLNSSTGKKKD